MVQYWVDQIKHNSKIKLRKYYVQKIKRTRCRLSCTHLERSLLRQLPRVSVGYYRSQKKSSFLFQDLHLEMRSIHLESSAVVYLCNNSLLLNFFKTCINRSEIGDSKVGMKFLSNIYLVGGEQNNFRFCHTRSGSGLSSLVACGWQKPKWGMGSVLSLPRTLVGMTKSKSYY